MIKDLKELLQKLKDDPNIPKTEYRKAMSLYMNGDCQVLSQGKSFFDVLVANEDEDKEVRVGFDPEDGFKPYLGSKKSTWNAVFIAALLQISEELERLEQQPVLEGKLYTREGMIKRVLEERKLKAQKANYKLVFGKSLYGEHTLIDEKGTKYRVTLRDFENETGYIDNADLKTNKLGTTKHLLYAFGKLKSSPKILQKLEKTYPFIEIYLDPLQNYRITWHYPHPLPAEYQALLKKYFGDKNYIKETELKSFSPFLSEASELPLFMVRAEVMEKVSVAWEREKLQELAKKTPIDFSLLKIPLFPYQQDGVAFATFKDGAIIADEMGLGKTIQAIAAAVMKKSLFGFKHTLIICPASLKEQWKKEIEKFSFEQARVIEGFPDERIKIYRDDPSYFFILNYETIQRDWRELNKMGADFVILDEAQRIKNFSTVTAKSIHLLEKKHALVLTGTPLENKLMDLYSIMQFADPKLLAPLWEFSYQHCYFDEKKADKITGYYNLKELNKRLKAVLIRREKRKVLQELPQITEITIPVAMHIEQQTMHGSFARGVSQILHKKFINTFDLQRLMLLMNSMRMVCDSTYLIDKETNISPKLHELKYVLLEKLDLNNNTRKVIIFSEWVTMLNLIGRLLHDCKIGFAQLTGKVEMKNRDKLIRKFETEPTCRVFLSTEAGGSGLNLQVADTVINFELPWNPAKKNQRIGRIDRLGQLSKHLTVINFITRGSIETNIASGLIVKQHLFDGVLNSDNETDAVDFSASGRSQFLIDLENIIEGYTSEQLPEEEALFATEPEDTQQDPEMTLPITEESEELMTNPALASSDKARDFQQVMNQGLDFLAGMYKLTTGKEMNPDGKRIEVDKETGEIVMRFKMPT